MADDHWQRSQATNIADAFPYEDSALTTQDSPATENLLMPAYNYPNYKVYQKTDSFSMWLMFKPSGNAIWVPLRKIVWSWSGVATWSVTTSKWEKTSDSHSVDPASAETSILPQWTGTQANVPDYTDE